MKRLSHISDFTPESLIGNISVIDMHTGGEPLRIPIHGLPEIPGSSVLQKRNYFSQNLDHLRTQLIFEPRGHKDMYGAILSESSSEYADFDVFFIHNAGYSTMCGHAIIALTKFVIESGLTSKGTQESIFFNVPAGRVEAWAEMQEGKVIDSFFKNVPSYVLHEDAVLEDSPWGRLSFDVAFGGAYYAVIDARNFHKKIEPANVDFFVEVTRELKALVNSKFDISHPEEPDLSFLYGCIFTGPPEDHANHSRNLCVFAEGEVDRSATGSGVSARAAIHHQKGQLALQQIISIESILGSTLSVQVVEQTSFQGFSAVIPQVSGKAFYSGKSTFWVDPDDPWKNGFLLR
ncbi:MAG: proline racemase [Saprospiraceae bacterium]|nr:proline racemase [Saprospiraceae bacterium]